jgi:hypothetical protein
MRRFTRRMPVLFLVAAAAMVLSAVPASAAIKSTVTITSGEGSEFTGKVTSPKAKCRAGRTVKLFREDDSGGGDDLVGTARTNKSGAWAMEGSFIAGVFYARVLPALIHINGMTYRCAGDVSLRQHF